MRVLVVGSCGKMKLYNNPEQPTCHDIDAHSDINYWKKRLTQFCASARDMYTGFQNSELVKGVDLLRTIDNVEATFVIVSAGFGILQEQDVVPPYDCSFTNMKMNEVRKRSQELKLWSSISKIIKKGFDLIYLALGKRYMNALGKDALSKLQIPTIMFHGQESDQMVRIPCTTKIVKAFSKRGHKIHGVIGFKGDLLRILTTYALEKPNPVDEVKKWNNPNYLKKLIHRLGGLEKPNG